MCSLFLPYINYVTLYECEHNQLVSFNTNPHWDNQSYTKKNEKERKLFDLVDYDPLFHVIRTTFLPIINLILFQYDCIHNQLVSFKTSPNWDHHKQIRKENEENCLLFIKLMTLYTMEKKFFPPRIAGPARRVFFQYYLNR